MEVYMSVAVKLVSDFHNLYSRNSTQVKTHWRDIKADINKGHPVVILNHKQPEAVILSPEVYQSMLGELEASRKRGLNDLEELSRRFDAKLAGLNASDSVEKINSLFSSDVENNRITRPKAGQTF
jgi:PHD/YefM family antitoxin component YafN of YafNO toxin-antitoxin module